MRLHSLSMLHPTQLLWDREERNSKIQHVTLYKSLNSPLYVQKDLYGHAANILLIMPADKLGFPEAIQNDTKWCSWQTTCDRLWLGVRVSCVWRERKWDWREGRQSITTRTHPIHHQPTPNRCIVFSEQADASLNEEQWANQTLWWQLSHQIAVKHAPDKDISWWLSHWTFEEGGQSLLRVRSWCTQQFLLKPRQYAWQRGAVESLQSF